MTKRKRSRQDDKGLVSGLWRRYCAANAISRVLRDSDQEVNFWAGHMFTLALRAYRAGQRAKRKGRKS